MRGAFAKLHNIANFLNVRQKSIFQNFLTRKKRKCSLLYPLLNKKNRFKKYPRVLKILRKSPKRQKSSM